MKKAFLVDVVLRTRVVVDVPDNWNENDDVLDNIGQVACDRLTGFVMSGDNPICLDNVGEINEDSEVQYGELDEDSVDESIINKEKDDYCDEIAWLLLRGKGQKAHFHRYCVGELDTEIYVYDNYDKTTKLFRLHCINITKPQHINTYVVSFSIMDNGVVYDIKSSDVDLLSLKEVLDELRIKTGI